MHYENGGTALAMVQNVPQRRVRIPLKDVRVDAKIVDVVAKMTVQQTYYNEEPNPIEVVYVFPLDTKAAVCQFSIRIDDHTVHGGMEDRNTAQETYQYAISEGHGAFLLEQPMPDVFQISIGNLAPGEQVDVTIAYLKLGDGELDENEFPIPTWFSPRSRPSTSSVSFLAVDERPEERKPTGRMVTRKVPLAPAPGDYFYFGASVGPRFAKGTGNTPAQPEDEEEVEREQAPVAAITSRELSLGLGGRATEEQQPEPAQVKSRGANSSATLVLTGGKGSVHASASSESQAVVETVIAEAVAKAVAEVRGGSSADATAEALARAVGSAAATAVADATVSVDIDGQGEGHGIAEADAKAVAKVITRAIAKAFAVAVGISVYAKGVGRAEVSETRLAEAVAHASAEAASKGGSAEASSTVVAEAVVEVVAEAMATALSSVADHAATAKANADAMVDATDEQVFVDTVDDAAVTGDSQATGQGTGDAKTSVLPDNVEARKTTSGLQILPQEDDEKPVTKQTSNLPIVPQPSAAPVPKKSSSLPIGSQPTVPVGKQSTTFPIGQQPTAGQPGVKKSTTLPIGAQRIAGPKMTSNFHIRPQKAQDSSGEGASDFEFRPAPPGWPQGGSENGTKHTIRKETSHFDFKPTANGWPSRPTPTGAGDHHHPTAKTTSKYQFRPPPAGWPTRPTMGSSEEDRPTAKMASNLQIRPQRAGWSSQRTSWPSNQNTEASGTWQSPHPSTSKMTANFQRFGNPVPSKQSSGQSKYLRPPYSAKTTSNFIIRQRDLESTSSPRQLAKDPVRAILDLQDVDGCFRLTQELAEALGCELEDALLEYNVFRASLGEDSLTSTVGAEPWAIALVLQTFELKMMDRKSDWQIPAFKASDLLAVQLGEQDFHAILSSARMYLFRLEKVNAIQE